MASIRYYVKRFFIVPKFFFGTIIFAVLLLSSAVGLSLIPYDEAVIIPETFEFEGKSYTEAEIESEYMTPGDTISEKMSEYYFHAAEYYRTIAAEKAKAGAGYADFSYEEAEAKAELYEYCYINKAYETDQVFVYSKKTTSGNVIADRVYRYSKYAAVAVVLVTFAAALFSFAADKQEFKNFFGANVRRSDLFFSKIVFTATIGAIFAALAIFVGFAIGNFDLTAAVVSFRSVMPLWVALVARIVSALAVSVLAVSLVSFFASIEKLPIGAPVALIVYFALLIVRGMIIRGSVLHASAAIPLFGVAFAPVSGLAAFVLPVVLQFIIGAGITALSFVFYKKKEI